jgi:hypothetical protein
MKFDSLFYPTNKGGILSTIPFASTTPRMLSNWQKLFVKLLPPPVYIEITIPTNE